MWDASGGREHDAVEAEGAEFLAQAAVGIEVGADEGFDVVEEEGIDLADGGDAVAVVVGESERSMAANGSENGALGGGARAGEREAESGMPAGKGRGEFREDDDRPGPGRDGQ